MSYFPTDIPFMSDEELIENGLKKPYKKPEIINSKDLVTVVRCRKCKFFRHIHAYDRDICESPQGCVRPLPDGFCSYGKRKE